MPTRKAPRKGSLQFWPRKRANKLLPRVNWNAIGPGSKVLKGFIVYKAGMASAIVKNNTPDSMTKGKRIAIPVTILEAPPIKILSARFYKNGIVLTEILADNLEKDLKRKIRLQKKKGKNIDEIKDFDDISVVAYTIVKKSGLKKKPDVSEIGLSGTKEEKLAFVKENLGKELEISDVFEKGQLVDFRGVTKGKGFQGPVKRFGVTLRQHKSEKGVRKVGSIGPWHPTRVTFRVPMAGQTGMNTRLSYNKKVIDIGKSQEDKEIKSLKNYGDVKTNFLIVEGSVQGPAKRQLIVTAPLRITKKQNKKNYELIKIEK